MTVIVVMGDSSVDWHYYCRCATIDGLTVGLAWPNSIGLPWILLLVTELKSHNDGAKCQ